MNHQKICIIITLIIILCIASTVLALPILIQPTNHWALKTTQIDKLHALGFYGENVTIGIIDTGIDLTHQEFEEKTVTGWLDTINNQPTAYDDDDHGTHLAGLLIAQSSYQGLLSNIFLQGIAPDSSLLVIKAIPQNQYLWNTIEEQNIVDSINYCVSQHVDIILLSLGMTPESVSISNMSAINKAITNACNNGIFVIVPAGNDGQHDDGEVIPIATIDYVISVGAISKTETIALFSSRGHQYPTMHDPHKKPEIVAPGIDLMSTRIHNSYGTQSGTAQAATYVCGILALLLNAYPEFKSGGSKNQNSTTIHLFKQILAETAKKIGNLRHGKNFLSHDDLYGYGLIQAYDLYKELSKYI